MDWKLGGLIGMVLLLSGCESQLSGGIPEPMDEFRAVNNAFAGRPFENVVMRYGVPDSKTDFRGLKMYFWHTTGSMQHSTPVTQTTRGRVGEPSNPYLDQVPYVETTTAMQSSTVEFRCMMRVGVKVDNTVDGIDFVGQQGACRHFMP